MNVEVQEDKFQRLPELVRRDMDGHRQVLEVSIGIQSSSHFEHHIALHDEAKLLNVPPYRYAHLQKGKIKRQVEDMLKNGLKFYFLHMCFW